MKQKVKNKKGKLWLIAGAALEIVLAIILAFILFFAVMRIVNDDYYPTAFDRRFFSIISYSMDGTIKKGSLVVDYVPTDERLDALHEDDIISFLTKDTDTGIEIIVTHRIIGVAQEGGQRVFITKGDNNDVQDRYHVKYADIKGIYTGTHYEVIGDIFLWLNSFYGKIAVINSFLVIGLFMLLAQRLYGSKIQIVKEFVTVPAEADPALSYSDIQVNPAVSPDGEPVPAPDGVSEQSAVTPPPQNVQTPPLVPPIPPPPPPPYMNQQIPVTPPPYYGNQTPPPFPAYPYAPPPPPPPYYGNYGIPAAAPIGQPFYAPQLTPVPVPYAAPVPASPAPGCSGGSIINIVTGTQIIGDAVAASRAAFPSASNNIPYSISLNPVIPSAAQANTGNSAVCVSPVNRAETPAAPAAPETSSASHAAPTDTTHIVKQPEYNDSDSAVRQTEPPEKKNSSVDVPAERAADNNSGETDPHGGDNPAQEYEDAVSEDSDEDFSEEESETGDCDFEPQQAETEEKGIALSNLPPELAVFGEELALTDEEKQDMPLHFYYKSCIIIKIGGKNGRKIKKKKIWNIRDRV